MIRRVTAKMQISVVIVSYRCYPELRACLESIAPCLGPGREAIIVDHDSDATEIAGLQSAFPSMRFAGVNENPGFAAGVNHGARLSAADYLLLVNPDSTIIGDPLSVLCDWMEDRSDAGVCGGLVRESDGTVQSSARRFPNFTTGIAGRTSWLSRAWPGNPLTARNLVSAPNASSAVEVDWVAGSCVMIRRRAFDEVGGMDEQFFLFWEDADLCHRLRDAGWRTWYYPVAGIVHLTGKSSSRVPVRSLVEFHRSAFRYFRKHASSASAIVTPLVWISLKLRLLFKLTQLGFKPSASPKDR
jgi:GT2 family glycosyltransferase